MEQLTHVRETIISEDPLLYCLEIGNKKLTLDFFKLGFDVAGEIENVPERERFPNATTILYTKAKELIARIASQRGHTIRYNFQTKNPTMKLWARDIDKGVKVFGWTERDFFGDRCGEDILNATARIRPI